MWDDCLCDCNIQAKKKTKKTIYTQGSGYTKYFCFAVFSHDDLPIFSVNKISSTKSQIKFSPIESYIIVKKPLEIHITFFGVFLNNIFNFVFDCKQYEAYWFIK